MKLFVYHMRAKLVDMRHKLDARTQGKSRIVMIGFFSFLLVVGAFAVYLALYLSRDPSERMWSEALSPTSNRTIYLRDGGKVILDLGVPETKAATLKGWYVCVKSAIYVDPSKHAVTGWLYQIRNMDGYTDLHIARLSARTVLYHSSQQVVGFVPASESIWDKSMLDDYILQELVTLAGQ